MGSYFFNLSDTLRLNGRLPLSFNMTELLSLGDSISSLIASFMGEIGVTISCLSSSIPSKNFQAEVIYC